MGYRFLCPAGGPGLSKALEVTQDFANILRTLPFRPSEAFEALAARGSPLMLAEAVALSAALLCWLWYLATRNCSHVDRMWSILPPIYVAIFAWKDLVIATSVVHKMLAFENYSAPTGGRMTALRTAVAESGADGRLLLATVLAAVWACRLTFNFWRKGGYDLRYEDYRWAEVRQLMHPVLFELFNLFFVALAQHVLCLLITLPAFVASTAGGGNPDSPPQPLGPGDWATACVFCLLFLGEVVADEQQWAFQQRKRQLLTSRQPRTGDYKRGFRTTGLFRFSRHPNFFCEYGMWWSFYVLCAVLPCRCVLGWSAVGAVGLTFLFHAGSLWITERISSCRYPDYSAYQAATSAIIPGLPKQATFGDGT